MSPSISTPSAMEQAEVVSRRVATFADVMQGRMGDAARLRKESSSSEYWTAVFTQASGLHLQTWHLASHMENAVLTLADLFLPHLDPFSSSTQCRVCRMRGRSHLCRDLR